VGSNPTLSASLTVVPEFTIHGLALPGQWIGLVFKEPRAWIKFDKQGKVLDPYKELPPVFDDVEEWPESLDEINNGGMALIAYARLQFEELPAVERKKLREALLRYCELDTLAMVMLYEGLRAFAEE